MHNPLRSETEVFRAVVIVGAGAGLVVALALIVGGPRARSRSSFWSAPGCCISGGDPKAPSPLRRRSQRAARLHRVLVVANQTVGGRALLDEIASAARANGQRCS